MLMRYLIQLKDQNTGFETEIVVENNMPLAKFADMVRRETSLPFTDSVRFHRIIAQGHIYMDGNAIHDYVHILCEGADDPNDLYKRGEIYREQSYTSESGVHVEDLFTVIGSACRYLQSRHSILCTLLDRED